MKAKILAEGPWRREQVEVTHRETLWEPPKSLGPEIERQWGKAMAEAGGKSLFDGPMARVERFVAQKNRFALEVGRTSYKAFFTVHFSHLKTRLKRRGELPNPLGVSVVLESADHQLLFGRRSSTVAYYPNRVHPFAGSMEPADADPFATALRELEEEAHLPADEVVDLAMLGVVEDPTILQPEAVIWARTSRTADEIQRQLDPEEHDALVRVPFSTVVGREDSALRRFPDDTALTPVCRGALELWESSRSTRSRIYPAGESGPPDSYTWPHG